MTSTADNPRIVTSEHGRKYVVFTMPITGSEYDPQMPNNETQLRELLEHMRTKRWVSVAMLERAERLIRAEWEASQ